MRHTRQDDVVGGSMRGRLPRFGGWSDRDRCEIGPDAVRKKHDGALMRFLVTAVVMHLLMRFGRSRENAQREHQRRSSACEEAVEKTADIGERRHGDRTERRQYAKLVKWARDQSCVKYESACATSFFRKS